MSTYTESKTYRRCQEIFDRTYPDFRDAGKRYKDLISTALTEDMALLDVGCGRISLAAPTIREARYSVGVDLMLSDLLHNNTVDDTAVADAGQLPFPAESFDVLVSQWVVEHFEHPTVTFREMARVLKPGGRLVFLTTNANNYIPLISRLMPDRLQRFLIEKLLRRPSHESFPTYYRANTGRAIRHIAKETGFAVEAMIYVGNPFYFAFSVPLFRLAMLFERITDRPALQSLKLYLVVSLRKERWDVF
jgi:ubiquinone/menaquinone biosynthesis C-methylase UbiE